MADKIVVAVLGNQKSGKSSTWNTLFGRVVRSSKHERRLWFNKYEWVNVFIVSASAEEKGIGIDKIIPKEIPKIVLCSMQYTKDVRKTIEFFHNKGYEFYVQWLNPGRNDNRKQSDDENIFQHLLHLEAVSSIVNAQHDDVQLRVNAINHYVYGWAKSRGLVTHEGWI